MALHAYPLLSLVGIDLLVLLVAQGQNNTVQLLIILCAGENFDNFRFCLTINTVMT